jgi:hypothetical protein
MTNYFDIHPGDEVLIGPLKGVRFWTYQFIDPSCTINSFQHDHEWTPGRATEANAVPTMENQRGLNVYKTIADAMRGSADAVNGVIEDVNGGWMSRQGGIVLGEVEFWGPAIEWEFGYTAQFVKPTRFLQAWGYQPKRIVDELNTLWFGGKHG